MKNQQMVEVHLETIGRSRMNVKVPDQGQSVGDWITLKDSENPKLRWRINWMSKPFDGAILKRGWDNNI